MISAKDALFRLDTARRYLITAEKMRAAEEWPGCIHYAQLAVESALKAILACLGPVPRSHDLAEWLYRVLDRNWPEEIRAPLQQLLPLAEEYGRKKHVLTTYGDEEAFLTPWDLFGETDAQKAVEDARYCIAVAEKVYEHQFGEPLSR